MSTATGLVKAKITLRPETAGGVKRKELLCSFNPQEYQVSTSATWKPTAAAGAREAPESQFITTNPKSMTMKLLFDDWDSKSGRVKDDVETLFTWTCPTPDSIKQEHPNPPIVIFQWGTTMSFEAFIKSVSATFSHFAADGTPIRATVQLTFEQVPVSVPRQNPTSGGQPGQRSVVVGAGDSLHSIAFSEYGDPGYWRALASHNEIHDPLRVRPGAVLIVPTIGDAAPLT